MDTLGDYPAYLWGDVLAEVVAAVFTAKIDAAEIGLEQRAVEKMRGGGGLNPPPPREN